jgi:glycosyltransferase involved in cell wall biosynthesis
MIKVLHINTFDYYGGAEKIAYTLYKAQEYSTLLVKQKTKYFDDAGIIEFDSKFLDKAILLFDKVLWKFGLKKSIKTYFHAKDQLNNTYKKLRQLKAYHEADIIHLHNLHGGYFDIKSLEKIALEKKVIWTVHDMWPITGGEAYTFVENGKITYKAGFEDTLKHYPLNNPLIDRRAYFLKTKKRIYNKVSKNLHFITVSKWLQESFFESPVFSKGLDVEVIYNGIDTSKFVNFKNRDWHIPRVLFFNSHSPFKGSKVFQDCLRNLHIPIELTVVGSHFSIPISDFIKVSYLNKIVDEKELVHLFNNVDILVFPSTAEAFGLLPAEAMLCGVFVLTSDAGGLKELVFDKKTGYTFKVGDSADLVEKLSSFLNDLEYARSIGERSREFVINNFDLQKMISSYQSLYEKVCNK